MVNRLVSAAALVRHKQPWVSVCLYVGICLCVCVDDHAGVGSAEELQELRKREKEAGYTPDWELDAFMKAEIRKGKKESIVTDLVIKLLGLDVRLFAVF